MANKAISLISSGLKGLLQFPQSSATNSAFSWALMPRSMRNYSRDVGDGLGNSIIVAAVNWISKNFPEAPLVVGIREGDTDNFIFSKKHPMVELIDRPNKFYSGNLLWAATLTDLTIAGNAYWIKVRNKSGKVVELWYTPHHLITPIGDSRTFISHYLYNPNGLGSNTDSFKYSPDDVVHFRFGLDPKNTIKGLSPLASLLREIYTDDEAANFSASLITNLGVPGVIITPMMNNSLSGGNAYQIESDAEKIKRDFKERFTGDKRGEPMIFTAPTDIKVLSWSPEQMDLKGLRRLPEERISAVLGIPAMVLGLGAGLAHSTFTNYKSAKEAAYENNIIPTQRLLAEELHLQLLRDFNDNHTNGEQHKVTFDLSKVRALTEDMTELYKRADLGVAGGWLKVSEARQLVGLPVDETHDMYLRSWRIMAVVPEKARDLPLQAIPNTSRGIGGSTSDIVPLPAEPRDVFGSTNPATTPGTLASPPVATEPVVEEETTTPTQRAFIQDQAEYKEKIYPYIYQEMRKYCLGVEKRLLNNQLTTYDHNLLNKTLLKITKKINNEIPEILKDIMPEKALIGVKVNELDTKNAINNISSYIFSELNKNLSYNKDMKVNLINFIDSKNLVTLLYNVMLYQFYNGAGVKNIVNIKDMSVTPVENIFTNEIENNYLPIV